MNAPDPFSDSVYEEQTHLAERELSSFIAAVKELYGAEQATISAQDWLDESEAVDSPPRSELRNWRRHDRSVSSTSKSGQCQCCIGRGRAEHQQLIRRYRQYHRSIVTI